MIDISFFFSMALKNFNKLYLTFDHFRADYISEKESSY